MALIDTETLDQYQKSLDDEAHWLTEYAQDKGPKVGQCIINITVTMHRAAWALRELMKSLPSAQPEIIRCKDCRYGVDYYHDGDCYCSNPKCELRYFGGSWEFYCADAERRER